MPAKPTVPVIGRLAVQMKLLDRQQLAQALRTQATSDGKRLGDVMVELGMINAQQLEKLQAVQNDLIAKHRAKQAAALAKAPQGAPAAAAPKRAPAAPSGAGPASSQPRPAAAAPPAAPAAQAPGSQAPAVPVQVADAARAAAVVDPSAPSLGLTMHEASDAHRQRLGQLLYDAVQSGASDVHIHAGATPKQRIGGTLEDMAPTPIGAEEAEQLVAAALDPVQRAELERNGELDFCLELPGLGRFRANCYRQQRGFDVVFRSIPVEPPTLASLGLPADLKRFTEYHQGMVLVTGPAGCGKSATLAALVNLINESREEHILTIEDPIEVVHRSKRCLVNQRHAGRHTGSFARALRGALREDPDIIVIGELRDLETISLAMTAAETGHFVLATLHTNNAVRTINRMIGAFPSAEQGQVRTMLSESLRAVISQRLVPKKDGSGRVPALELLVINKAISNLVREEKTVQIRSAIQTGKGQGVYLLEQSLNELVRTGVVQKEVALRFAEDKKMVTGQ
jgi:twitching motility protein PilT